MDVSRPASAQQAIPLHVDYPRQNALFADYLKNISRGGTFIPTERPLPTGTRLAFTLNAPGLQTGLHIGGKVTTVTHTEDASRANPAGMGIELVYASREEQEAFHSRMEALMTDAFGARLTAQLLRDVS
jgi:type IV pilus assembly protein PilZ